MGLLRLWLAMNVVGTHAQVARPWLFDGIISVQGFYAISGFYMAMVLEGKYHGRLKDFYLARFWRIWPAYILVFAASLAATWLASKAIGSWIGAFQGAYFFSAPFSPLAWAWMAFSQISLVGSDLYFFQAIDTSTGSFYFSPDLWREPLNAVHLLVLQQSWSLGIELVFYALAPFMVRLSSRALSALLLLGIALRFILVGYGLPEDPWANRCLPIELTVFCAGILAWRYYRDHQPQGSPWLPLALAAAALIARQAGLHGVPLRCAFFLSVALCLPAIFSRFKDSAWDRQLGELSYPLYLTHFTILQLGVALQTKGLWPHHFNMVILVCLVAAWLFWKWVDQRIEKYRVRWSGR